MMLLIHCKPIVLCRTSITSGERLINMRIERGVARVVKPCDCHVAEARQGNVGWVALSSSDLAVPVVHVEVVYAFQHSSLIGNAAVELEDALGKVLVEYREWAGRLGLDANTGRPAIELNDEGALFVEAVADGSLQELLPFDPSPLMLDLVPPNRGAPELLLAQVTKFKCGGVALGVARHHRVADGEAASKFMEAWACACKGLPIRPILHDRGALMPNEPPMPTFPHEEYKKPPLKLEAAKPSLQPLVRKKLHFDLETLQRIKSSGVREGGFTTFESLTGHLWRCVTKARGLAGDVETRSLVAANGRRRLSPALPENYFGNVIFHANPKTTVRRLLEEPLSYAAGLVHASIRRLDNDYMRSAVDYVEQERRNPAPDVARSRSTVLSPNLSVTSWVQLPLYRLDFGWDTPLFAGPPFVPFEGLVILTPSHTQDGSIDALVALFADDMAKLESICFDTTLYQ